MKKRKNGTELLIRVDDASIPILSRPHVKWFSEVFLNTQITRAGQSVANPINEEVYNFLDQLNRSGTVSNISDANNNNPDEEEMNGSLDIHASMEDERFVASENQQQ